MERGSLCERPPHNAERPPVVTVYLAAGGWQSVCLWWNPEMGCAEPWAAGIGPYRVRTDAIADATEWAKAWQVDLHVPPMKPDETEVAPTLVESLASVGLVVDLDDPNNAPTN